LSQPDPQFDPSTALTVGRILAPQGVHGEVKVEPLTDFPERFDAGSVLWLQGAPVRVKRSRWQARGLYVVFDGIESRNEAEALRGAELKAPASMALPEDTFYRDDLIGLKVCDEGGQLLGEIADIFSTGSNDVYVVKGSRGELLLPALEDVVKQVDLEGGRVTVLLVEGLEWIGGSNKQAAEAGGRRRRTGKAREA
jgi:16S rRNA processing protein RimM